MDALEQHFGHKMTLSLLNSKLNIRFGNVHFASFASCFSLQTTKFENEDNYEDGILLKGFSCIPKKYYTPER